MLDAGRRPMGRLCCWVVMMVAALGFGPAEAGGRSAHSPLTTQTTTTTISDTVYRADGTAAQGTLIITWPTFVTASGTAVGAGATDVTLGANGALSIGLVANAGATPAGVYYTVIYQLGAGEVKTEYWIVPVATTAVTLAEVRATPGSGAAGQPVSMQYLNSELATKANDNAVVHLGGTEMITGTKSFSSPPNVPNPQNSGDVANKAYVDSSVSNVGSGNYLSTAGGTMSGAITLPADPSAPMQATTKEYVDNGAAAKADLLSGLIPAREMGAGAASSGSCLLGNGANATWGTCGGGSGTGNLSTAPAATQAIAQPEGTQFSANNLANIRYVTASWNWQQSPADNLGTAGANTIHLSPCPLGMDTASSSNYYGYKVYIAGTGTAEAVTVTGGSCAPGTTSGTITVATQYAHAAGYTVGSATSGIQEAWNDAWTNDAGSGVAAQAGPYVKLAADQQYSVYASIYLRGRGGVLDGAGALLMCSTRDRCIFVGTTQGYPYVNDHKIYNLSGASTWNVDGVQVAGVSATTGTYTVTAARNHSFVVGDTVDCEYHSQGADQHFVSPVLTVPSSTTFTVHLGTASFSSGTTFGFCALLNTFIENNSDHAVVQDVNIFQSNPGGMGVFTYGIVNDNDQQFIVERVSNRASSVLLNSVNWPMGAFLYERNDQGNAGIMYVHNSELTNVNCVTAGGNGFVMTDSVCQGVPAYAVRYFGGLQPATLQNIYEEAGGTVNPLYGITAQQGDLLQGGQGHKVLGTWPTSSAQPGFATGGGSGAERTYFVVPRSSTLGYGPVLLAGWAQPATTSTSITAQWPSIEFQASNGQSVGTLTWDVLVTTGTAANPPYGSGTFAIATNISGSCGTNGMCSFTDTQAAPQAYTVQAQQFNPMFWYWPVNFVINNTLVLADAMASDPQAVASQGTKGVSIIAEQCSSGGTARRRSPIWINCLASSTDGGSGSIATVLQEQDQAGNGPAANSKGRLNFGKAVGFPNDLITLQDSNFAKTLAISGERPSNDAGDMALGLDQAGGMTERAAASITSYINALPSGTNWLERLTAGAKTFNVPVMVNGNLSVTGTTTLPITGTSPQCLHVSATGVVTGTGSDCGSGGGGGSGTVSNGVSSQVAMYSGNGTTVSGDSALTDNGSTLNYAGSGGVTAASGTFSGNLTVNGQLLVAGPWMVSSPVPGTAMAAAGAGTSSLGISNDGNFYISANAGTPQKVATIGTSSYFSNLFQEDANDVGQFTVGQTAAQNLHVYSSYTNSSSWQRTSLGFDTADLYAVVKSENSTAGQAPGLGFWINSGLKWVIDPTSNLKPWIDMAYNIGSLTASSGVGLRPATVYVAGSSTSNSGFELGRYANNSYELCNDATNGTVINGLATLTSAGCAVKPMSAVTTGVIGVVIANAGTSGTVTLVRTGSAYCNFDATATTVGDYVVPSGVSGSYSACHDAGTTMPSGQQILGRVLQATPGGITAQMFFDMPGSSAGPSTVSSVFGRTGTVTASSGDYSVAQVTGAAPLASPALTGTVTLPDGSTVSSSAWSLSSKFPTLNQSTTGTAANLSGTPALPNGTTGTTQTAGDTSTKVATDQFVVATEAGTYATWGAQIFGTTSASTGYGSWTTPAAITVTGMDLYVGTPPVGCSTNATVQIYDLTGAAVVGSYTTTLTAGTNFYAHVSGSANVAANHNLTFRIGTAAAGCSTNAANILPNLTYVMQAH